MPVEGSLRIVVADDHPSVRENLRYLLNAEPDLEVVGVARDGASAIRVVREARPDVVILDHSLPDQNGLAVARTIHQEGLARRVILYTLDAEVCEGSAAAGVDACVVKDDPSSTLLAAIRGSREPAPHAEARVLVIEDDADAREMMRMALEDPSLEIVEAADGLEALVEAVKRPPSVVLLDLSLPTLSGKEFLTAYRRIRGEGAPVVVVSGATGARQVARELHASAFIAKPFSIDELANVVRKFSSPVTPSPSH